MIYNFINCFRNDIILLGGKPMEKDLENKELYKTKTNLDFEEYKKYNKAVLKKFNHNKLVILIIILIMLLYYPWKYKVEELTIPLVLIIIFGTMIGIGIGMIILKLLCSSILKKSYKTLEKHTPESLKTEIYFYEIYLVQKSAISTYQLNYDKVYDWIETNDNFYIMTNQRQGIVIIKKNCSKKLISFLQQVKIGKEENQNNK